MGGKITYSIKEIFDITLEDSVLREKEAEAYYIPPYQRGYKWSSDGKDSPVHKLMTDLFTAFDIAFENSKKQKNEYYLQFITVKRKEVNGKKVLEVIDGQQRLTTLTILMSVLQEKISHGSLSIANNLLSYGVRDVVMDFFSKFIYTNIKSLFNIDWDDLFCQNKNYDEQDIWYLFSAVKLINKLLEEKFIENQADYNNFKIYLFDNVKILLNNIELNISAEEIFTNMNYNKIELTNSELLKGLLLIYSAREKVGSHDNDYKEELEIRNRMGRQWDDVSHWVNKVAINRFFFSKMASKNEPPMESFLLIFALKENYKQDETKKNSIFNYFESKIRSDSSSAADYFEKMILLKFILNEWYSDKDIHNKLGYLFFSKTKPNYSIKNFLDFIFESKTEIKEELKRKVLEVILNIDPLNVEYGDHNNEIQDILLSINVFDTYSAFDFCLYNDPKIKWSLEHIFPQNPDELPQKLGSKDIELIRSLLDADLLDNYDKAKDVLHSLYIDKAEETYENLKQKIKEDSLDQIYTKDERTMLFKLMRPNKLNTIGNMALLDIRDNIANSNGMFDFKRLTIVKKISAGSFVPKHTYDVFSKLLSSDMSKDLTAWKETDINAHGNYIVEKIKSIQEKL